MDPAPLEDQQLLTACESGDFQTALQLLPKDSPLITIGPEGFTPLHYACRHGAVEITRILITQYKYSITSPSKDGQTPVHLAAQYGHTDILRFLAEYSIVSERETVEAIPATCSSIHDFVTLQNEHGHTPLHTAAAYGHLPAIKYLVREIRCNPTCTKHNRETPLHLAAQNGHVEVVKYLVDGEGCPTSLTDEHGRTPLYLAAGRGQLEVVRYLIQEKNCNPNTGTTKRWKTSRFIFGPGRTPLHIASREGHLNVVHYLVNDLQCDPSCTDEDGVTPLHLASQQGHLSIVQFLVCECQCDPLCLTKEAVPRSSLHMAANTGQLPVAQFLVEKGCNPMVRTRKGWTPLHFASSNGHLDTVRYLTNDDHVDPSCRDEDGVTPLRLASFNGHLAVVQFLVEKGCDPIIRDINGRTPLHGASLNGYLDTVTYLTNDNRVDLSCQDEDGLTPLRLASFSGHLAVVQFLVEKGCDPTIRDINGRTPLHGASLNGYLDTVTYLANDDRVNPSCQDEDGNAPLHLASFNGHLAVIQLLFEKGCNPNWNGETPLHLAAQNGHLEVVKYLVDGEGCPTSPTDEHGRTPLYLAAGRGQLEVVRYLMHEKSCDPNAGTTKQWKTSDFTFGSGRTPLHTASREGHLNLVHYLVNNLQCDPSCTDEDGVTPLHLASQQGHLSIVQFLVCECQCGPLCLTKEAVPRSSLHMAANTGQLAVVQFLVEKGYNPMVKTRKGWTPLHFASSNSHLDTVRYLSNDDHVDPSCRDEDGVTPLRLASLSGHLAVVQFLVEKGCDPIIRDINGRTPLHGASLNGQLHTVTYLTNDDRVDPSCQDEDGNTPLHLASFNGHLAVIQLLFEKGCNPNWNGETPLHLAAQNGHLEVVKYLVDGEGCSTSPTDEHGRTPLYLAAGRGQLEVVRYLMHEKSCDPNAGTTKRWKTSDFTFGSGRTPLHTASREGHLNVVHYLVNYLQCDPSCTDEDGVTPLHLASQQGHLSIVQFLVCECQCDPLCLTKEAVPRSSLHMAANTGQLPVAQFLVEKGCNPMVRTRKGRTPLHFASSNGHLDTVRYLTNDDHVDPSCRDEDGVTPLRLASFNGHLAVVQFLVEKGCDPIIRDINGRTPLHGASLNGYLDTVTYLTNDDRVDPSCQDEDGLTPLRLASFSGHLAVVQFLVEKGCDPTIRDINGRTPLHGASLNGYLEAVTYLTSDKSVDPSSQDDNGVTPLHLASSNGHLAVVQFLVEKGCDPMARTLRSWTPLHYASLNGYLDIVRYLTCDDRVDPSCVCQGNLGGGFTSLHFASHSGHLEVVRHLIQGEHCDPSQCASVWYTPILLAYLKSQMPVVLYLHSKGEVFPSSGHLFGISHPHLEPLSPLSRIFVVGNQSSGKSTLVTALSAEGSRLGRIVNVRGVTPGTAGIVPSEFVSREYGKVTFYDFAGHPEYYAAHELVFEHASHPVILIVVDLSKDHNSIGKALRFWRFLLLNSVSAAGFEPHVIVVGSHVDRIHSQDLSGKAALLEQFSSSSRLLVVGYTLLDCRKSSSEGMSDLHDLLKKCCKTIRVQAEFDYLNGRILYTYLTEHLSATPACTLRELEQKLLEADSSEDLEPLKSPDLLYQTCDSLNTSGHLLLLKNQETPGESWLILNKEAILSRIHGLLKHLKPCTELGIVPLSLLKSLLKEHAQDLPPDLAIRYMKKMAFCSEVDPKVLKLTANLQPVSKPGTERHFLFPSLVGVEKPTQVWEWTLSQSYTYTCGYHLKCSDPNHFFTPRFLQMLQMELACRFALQTTPSSLSLLEPQRGCRLWLNGIRWISDGIEVVMHVGNESKLLGLMLRCIEGREMKCVQLRSTLIQLVFAIKEKVFKEIKTTEYLLHPHCLRAFPMPECANLPLSQVASAIVRKETSISLDDPALSDAPGYPFVLVRKLLYFEPYEDIGEELLQEVFDHQNLPNVIQPPTLYKLVDALYKRWQLIAVTLHTPPAVLAAMEAETRSDFDKCFEIINRWSDREGTYSALLHDLGEYSVFHGRNPLEFCPHYVMRRELEKQQTPSGSEVEETAALL